MNLLFRFYHQFNYQKELFFITRHDQWVLVYFIDGNQNRKFVDQFHFVSTTH